MYPDVSGQREVVYDQTELDELVLSYAVSVHKSQGSEYPIVVRPVVTQHYIMLQRNLLYTAITRARELVVLIGTKKALAIAVRNNKVETRYTRLAASLSAPTRPEDNCEAAFLSFRCTLPTLLCLLPAEACR